MRYRMHSKRRRDERRQDAAVRQDAYDALSIADRIKLARSRRGESKRELVKLQRKQRKTGG